MNPNDIAKHENGQTGDAQFSGWILAERHEELHENEKCHICMHDVIQPSVRI